jgi:fructokinase
MGGTVVSWSALAGSGDNLILVGGEALFDLVPVDDANLRAHPGGGPFNAARTIARLGEPVAYLGRLSADRFGATLRRMLADDGVLLDAVVDTEDPTTLALAEVDQSGSAVYRFYESGTSAPGLTPEAAVAALPADVGFVHVGTFGFEPLSAALEAVVDELAGRALVAVDPNVRPGRSAADPDAYRARLDRVIARSDVVKLSEDDLAWMEPGEHPRALLDRGPTAVLLTRGAAGALVVGAGGEVEIPAPEVQVVDTIGAGDAFGGAFLAWWRSRELARDRLADLDAVAEATRFAALVAAITCTRAGASPPRLGELPAA